MPEEIAETALACVDAGASIIHNHIDRRDLGGLAAAERYIEGCAPLLAKRPDAVVYCIDGFGRTMEERPRITHPRRRDLMSRATLLVENAIKVIRSVGRPVADCAESAGMLGLPR